MSKSLWILIVFIFVALWLTEWTAAARACKRAGGSYFIVEDKCLKLTFEPVTPQPRS